MKKIIQLVGISLIIVVLPAASWYFLKSGLDYRMDSMDKLGSYGDLPSTELVLSNGKQVHTDRLDGKMVIIHELSPTTDTSLTMQFYRQFAKRKELHFIMSTHDDLMLKADRVDNLWLIAPSELNGEFVSKLGLGKGEQATVITDINGVVRNTYHIDSETELRQMVEHTAFLLPVEETAKPEMIRATEK